MNEEIKDEELVEFEFEPAEPPAPEPTAFAKTDLKEEDRFYHHREYGGES